MKVPSPPPSLERVLQLRLPGHDDLESITGPRLLVDGVPVHDRQRRGLYNVVATALRDLLPGVSFTCHVQRDLVGQDAVRFVVTEGPKRPNAPVHVVLDERNATDRTNPTNCVDVPAVPDVGHPGKDLPSPSTCPP